MRKAVANDSSQPYQILGCIPPKSGEYEIQPPTTAPELGSYDQLPTLLRKHHPDIIILGQSVISKEDTIELSNFCEKEYVQFKVMPSYFQILISGLKLETMSGVTVLGVSELPLDCLFNRTLKRIVDIVGSLVGLVISSPLIATLGTIIYIESRGSVFYRQVRTGKAGKNFEIIKLRSMRLDAEQEGGAQWAKRDDSRRLRIGAFMREWNLDELPQFWNVLKGDMSLVGPRPERPELIVSFKDEIPHYNARHSSKPGITGWAQIHGLRGNTSLIDRVRYDLYYLENWSLWLDFQIMIQTFAQRKNAY
jgi:exopolysaccharide biosynthesis polyprenyl glycosylphosphotransferase